MFFIIKKDLIIYLAACYYDFVLPTAVKVLYLAILQTCHTGADGWLEPWRPCLMCLVCYCADWRAAFTIVLSSARGAAILSVLHCASLARWSIPI